LVCAKVRSTVEELSDEIEVVRLDLDAIESSFHRIPCCSSKISHRLANFISAHWARCNGGFLSGGSNTLLLRIHIRRGHRQCPIEEIRMRHSAGVPNLGVHQGALLVNGISTPAPATNLFGAP